MAKTSLVLAGIALPEKVTMVESKNYTTFEKEKSEKKAWLMNQTLSMNSALKELGSKIRKITPEHAKALHQSPVRARAKVKTTDQLISVLKTFFR